MRDKVPNWMYVAAIAGLLQISEFVYNRFDYKLPGQLLGLSAILLTVVWLAVLGVRQIARKGQ